MYLEHFSYNIISNGKPADSVVYFFSAEPIEIEPIDNVKIIMIYPVEWNLSMTPWKHNGKGMLATGGADSFIEYFREVYSYRFYKEYIGGYSLGGLMAMYMAYTTDLFDGVASVSGSMWYHDAEKYFLNNSINERIKKIYFSIGDKEHLTKNEERAEVLDKTKNIAMELSKSKEVYFELNEGGHFSNVTDRIKKAINYLVTV